MPGLGIAIVLLIGYVVTVTKNGATDVTAYRRGKEAPSIEKFRTRHREKQQKGKHKLTAPSKPGGKQPGPLRQWVRAVADNAAAEVIERQNTKSEARRKWYRQNAPQRTQQWQQKWQAKLDKREQRIRKWGQKKGILDPSQGAAAPPAEQAEQQRSAETRASGATPEASKDGLAKPLHQPASKDSTDTGSETTQQHSTPQTQPTSTPASPTFPADNAMPTTESGGTVYEQAAHELRESAEEIRRYCQDMDQFADALSGRGYGNEITGLAGELSSTLIAAGDRYADLAEEVQQQGDAVRDAHDQTNHQIPEAAAMAN